MTVAELLAHALGATVQAWTQESRYWWAARPVTVRYKRKRRIACSI